MYHKQRGFTIIELMLAMLFVSILLISVAMLTIQIGHLYSRGITMKEVNQAGTEITDDIKRSIGESFADSMPNVVTTTAKHQKLLCTGVYTYIANGPAEIENNGPQSNLLKYSNGAIVRLAKITDPGGTLCQSILPTTLPSTVEATELLSGGDRSLVVDDFTLSPSSLSDSTQALYTVDLTLRTGTASELSGDQCRPPADVQSGDEYCAIDTFTVIARVGNTSKD